MPQNKLCIWLSRVLEHGNKYYWCFTVRGLACSDPSMLWVLPHSEVPEGG